VSRLHYFFDSKMKSERTHVRCYTFAEVSVGVQIAARNAASLDSTIRSRAIPDDERAG